MYRLISPQAITSNVVTLASPFIQDIKSLTAAQLKIAYQQYLKKLQPHCPTIKGDNLFVASDEIENAFAGYFTPEEFDTSEIEKQVDANKVMYPDAQIRNDALKEAFHTIKTFDPTFAEIFSLVMNVVFCVTSSRIGGTSVNPQYIGVMCAYHDMTAEPRAVPELLIHEFTHNTLFLDELRYGHFNYEALANPDTFLDASDRGVHFKLPVHRCLHSLIVSAEILLARDAFIENDDKINQHLSSKKIVERSLRYVKTMRANPTIIAGLKPRGLALFEICEKYYHSHPFIKV